MANVIFVSRKKNRGEDQVSVLLLWRMQLTCHFNVFGIGKILLLNVKIILEIVVSSESAIVEDLMFVPQSFACRHPIRHWMLWFWSRCIGLTKTIDCDYRRWEKLIGLISCSNQLVYPVWHRLAKPLTLMPAKWLPTELMMLMASAKPSSSV